MEQPLSLVQARKICKHYQFLKGRILAARSDLSEPILHVVVAPYDELNKWIFLQNFSECGDSEQALEFYKPPYFDVILIARFKHQEGYYFQDLRTYCTGEEIHFDLESFTTLTDPVLKHLK